MMYTFGKITIVFLLLVGLQAPVVSIAPTVYAQEAQDGEKGDKGDKGEEGQAGEDGQDGEAGQPSGDEPAQDGESGEEGDNGDSGDNGEAGDSGQDGDAEENGEDGGDATDGGGGSEGGDGGDGEQGEDGNDQTGSGDNGEGDTEINTGNASSTGHIQNTGNTNEINSCVETDKSEGKGGKEENEGGEDEECVSGSGGETDIENNNDANAQNNADIGADTGDNEASGNNGSSTIETGDALAILDLFNLINTNVIDSNGLFVLLSNLQQELLDMDVRDWMPYLHEYNKDCGDSCYSLEELEILNQNLAEITNNVKVTANTGGNEASGNEGNGSIETGDAYAAANVVNIANTNIINSNYLLFVANNFGNFFGDIVFPNASSFFSSLFSSQSKVYSDVDIENSNTANIENNVAVEAETGGNQANGNGISVVQTGDSNAVANVFNQANMNIVGGNSFVALIRVSGDWSGEIFGLPEGISWQQTPNGIMLYSDDLGFGAQGESSSCDNCGEQDQSDGKKGGKGSKAEQSELSVQNTNTASITNNVEVYALTGDNQADGNGKGGKIETGNAQAIANVVNVANTNVIGANWLFAMFNILGDFNGNISFGRPDLWIGQRAEIPNDPALPGDEITYYLTVVNNGDVPANNVQIKNIFDDLFFVFEGSSQEHTSLEKSEIVWDLGTLNPGQGLEISFTGNIRTDIPYGDFAFTNSSTIVATESDDNTEDNTDVVELLVHNPEPGSGGGNNSGGSSGGGNGGGSGNNNGNSGGNSGTEGSEQSGSENAQGELEKEPNLKVTKTYSSEGDVHPGDSVDYTVVITNMDGGSAYEAVLVDTLETEQGEVVHEEVWELGEVFPDEEITVTYSIVFEDDAKAGLYYNAARVEAENGVSNTATTSIELKNNAEVLLSIEEDLNRIAAQAQSIQGDVFALSDTSDAQEESEQTVSEASDAQEEQPVSKEPNPFLASVTGALGGFGPWLSALAAFSLLLLFFLLRRRSKESVQGQ